MQAMKHILIGAMAAVLVAVAPAAPAVAHTESDLVAVPAGTEATVTLQPTHGCGESPTVAVRIRAPFPDAAAEDVDGWTATATPDGAGNTVLEWTGGVLPADADGAFPVTFIAPDTPGVLLTFPAIQVCADGEELAWISGDPADEYPAPRVLVLPAGSEAGGDDRRRPTRRARPRAARRRRRRRQPAGRAHDHRARHRRCNDDGRGDDDRGGGDRLRRPDHVGEQRDAGHDRRGIDPDRAGDDRRRRRRRQLGGADRRRRRARRRRRRWRRSALLRRRGS